MPGSNRSAGKRRLRYELPPCPITGRRRQRCETIHGTKADGDRILRERYREIDQRLHTKNITVVQMAEKYLGKYVANHCKTTTYESYEEQLRVHILPALGHLHLDKLNRETVQGFLNAKLAENSKHGRPRSIRAVEYMHTVLKAMLNVAVEWEYLHYNPAILKASWNTRKIKRERPPKQVVILTREQVDQFFLITQNNPSFYVVYVLALLSGLRRGELLGLTWADVDLVTGVLVIRQSLIRTKKHGLKPDRPKSDTSYRSVVLGDQAISLLKQHRRKQQEIKPKMGQAYDDQDWVFCRPDGTPWDPKTCYSHFKKLLAKAGLPPQTTLHHMRHNFVTGRIDAGHDIKEVSEDAGHAGIGITKRYDHETLERKRKAARELEERFFSKPRARKRRTGKRSAGRP